MEAPMVKGSISPARSFESTIRFASDSSTPSRLEFSLQEERVSSLPRVDRSVANRTTLEKQGHESGLPDTTPAERFLMVWPLTLAAWAFKEPNVVQPRLQRHVVRVVRRKG
jgi:hypothetical protein